MTKQHRKEIRLPAQPIGRGATLYTQSANAIFIAGILVIVFVGFGIGMFFQKVYPMAIFMFLMAGAVIHGKFTEVQKLYISDDTMFVDYLTFTKAYKAHEIESVEWKTVAVQKRTQYEFRPILQIKTTNGKTIEVPPPGKYDIQKSILKWCEKYQMTSERDVSVSE